MKKRILAYLLAVILGITSLAIPAGATATTRFSDVADQNTAITIETLRLMGVLDGYGDGTFRPANQLTRAQFCKMAAYVMDGEAELGRYRTVTIFPDVKPSHWASSYINLAAKGRGIISGYPDGNFYPERTVTVGHAVTILLRLLGYKDEDIGGIWPDSYMAVGTMIGLTDGVSSNGNSPLTRAQAARLFFNLLNAEKSGGGTLYSLSKETELRSVDGSTSSLKTSDGTYTMVHPVSSTSLIGARGYVVSNSNGKALTFLPITSGNGGTASGAVVVYQDRSTAGFSDLAGNSSYTMYKNGLPITIGDIRKNDVATYYPDTNAIRICDTRVTVYYESCEPNPSAPTKITVLGGTEFNVLPAAMDSLAKFKPGKQMTLLLTADGQVAAAVEATGTAPRSNAMGIVSDDGTITMLCGTTEIPLHTKADEKYYGQFVRISSSQKDIVTLSSLSGGVSGNLDVSSRKLGSKVLAENVLIYDKGQQISLSQLTNGLIQSERITYARTNWAGNVDLIVLSNGINGDMIYGKIAITEYQSTDDNGDPYVEREAKVIYGNNLSVGPFDCGYPVANGSYVAATVKNNRYTGITTLTCLKKVSKQSWIGTGSVLFGGRSYAVEQDVLCYNSDSKTWVTLEQAMAYASTMDLYVHDGVVRIIQVSH